MTDFHLFIFPRALAFQKKKSPVLSFLTLKSSRYEKWLECLHWQYFDAVLIYLTMKSSLTFQLSLHLGCYVLGAFAIAEVAIMLYKYIGEESKLLFCSILRR